MPPILISLLAKLGPYAAAALIAFGGGVYVTHKFDLGAIDAAKLALAAQVQADDQAAAAANAKAEADLAAAKEQDDQAMSQLQIRLSAAQTAGADLRTQIAKQAGEPDQDAPLAPVLATTLDVLAASQGKAP
jgi:hypothetical protein